MINDRILFCILFLVGIITLLGLPLDLMYPDATLYGSISKLMYVDNDYINLYSIGKDWLDKPHIPFWLTAFSFQIFGISNFSYKLPGVIIFFIGCWYTYKFTKENYSKETALIASIILLTSLHSVISNFDVRAEPYLTSFIIISVYWFYKYIQTKKFSHLVWASLFCAFSVMTKGVFVLITIGASVGGELLIKRKWKTLFHPIWIISLLLILLFITPELYTLYHQFDAHPEKVVFGKTNVSGLKFFFWDSQFGRFFNTGPIKGSGDPFFFIHTILWVFLPWSLLFYIASFFKFKRNLKKVQHNEEFYSFFGVLVTLLLFSLSSFQLPHYSNIVFPFMAIITADFIVKLKDTYRNLQKVIVITQVVVCVVAILIISFLFYLMKPDFNGWFLFVVILVIAGFWFVQKNHTTPFTKSFHGAIFSSLLLYGFMMTLFYPTILPYQGGVETARFANKNFPDEQIFVINDGIKHKFGFEFYLNKPISRIDRKVIKNQKKKLFFSKQNELDFFKKSNIPFTIEKEFKNYYITQLSLKFLNAKTRNSTLETFYLIRMQ